MVMAALLLLLLLLLILVLVRLFRGFSYASRLKRRVRRQAVVVAAAAARVAAVGRGIVVPSVGVGARRRETTPFLSATFLSVVIRRGGRRVAAIK